MISEEMLAKVEKVYDVHDVGTPQFVNAIKRYVTDDLSAREVVRIGWKARTPDEFLRIWRETNWWKDSESATVSTVNRPAINPEAFQSMFNVSREMRDAGCDVRTTAEIFQRMLVVWCAQNDMPIDETIVGYDDLQAYERHKRPAGLKSG